MFGYGVLGDLVHLPKGKGSGLYDRLEEKAAHQYDISFSVKTHIFPETIRSWRLSAPSSARP